MSYYILNRGFALCGYEGLPFGLRTPRGAAEFFSREQYEMVLMLDGKTDLDPDTLTEAQRPMFDRLLERKVIRELEAPEGLLPEQTYRFYPAMYKRHIQWSITGACNYRCRHCFMSAPDSQFTEPTWEQCQSAIRQMAECGIKEVSLTGGEPLISPHFYPILDECIARGIGISTIYSNGRLVTPQLLDELERRNLHPSFQMSFDGIGWHDWLRGVEGAEQAVLKAFALCRDRGFSTGAAFALHRHNLEGFNESLRLLDSLGLRHVKANITSPTGLWASQTEHFLDPDETYQYLLETALPQYMKDDLQVGVQFCLLLNWNPKTGEGFVPGAKFTGHEADREAWACGSVKNTGYLSPEGYVLPCMTMVGTKMQESFRSLYDRPLRDILTDSAYTRVCLMKMGEVVDAHDRCRDCQYQLYCGAGCRACGIGETGTDRAIDREVCHFFRAGWFDKATALLKELTA